MDTNYPLTFPLFAAIEKESGCALARAFGTDIFLWLFTDEVMALREAKATDYGEFTIRTLTPQETEDLLCTPATPDSPAYTAVQLNPQLSLSVPPLIFGRDTFLGMLKRYG
ncbi:hypothetical protein [Frigoriglobus tundricola]|uniref:Uncharacterized protein n=1 Tax=Frigoriglobus tundricola TaxID=2774151 RepID=A0A6M5YLA0_9BACT|nr:hypothetical protein [Frigoriglobus tundricola]QJW94705.1 hypothetical protein FTUN_2227 [Frigoriglobus tundricola]